jgi:hypothetical protein
MNYRAASRAISGIATPKNYAASCGVFTSRESGMNYRAASRAVSRIATPKNYAACPAFYICFQ